MGLGRVGGAGCREEGGDWRGLAGLGQLTNWNVHQHFGSNHAQARAVSRVGGQSFVGRGMAEPRKIVLVDKVCRPQ